MRFCSFLLIVPLIAAAPVPETSDTAGVVEAVAPRTAAFRVEAKLQSQLDREKRQEDYNAPQPTERILTREEEVRRREAWLERCKNKPRARRPEENRICHPMPDRQPPPPCYQQPQPQPPQGPGPCLPPPSEWPQYPRYPADGEQQRPQEPQRPAQPSYGCGQTPQQQQRTGGCPPLIHYPQPGPQPQPQAPAPQRIEHNDFPVMNGGCRPAPQQPQQQRYGCGPAQQQQQPPYQPSPCAQAPAPQPQPQQYAGGCGPALPYYPQENRGNEFRQTVGCMPVPQGELADPNAVPCSGNVKIVSVNSDGVVEHYLYKTGKDAGEITGGPVEGAGSSNHGEADNAVAEADVVVSAEELAEKK